MKKKLSFEIEGVEYNLPDYISIEKYVKVFKIKDLFEDEYFSAKLLSILTDANVDELLEINYQILENLASIGMKKFPQNNNKFYNTFEFEGVEYGFIPDWKKMSYGTFVDLDYLLNQKGNELLDSIHLITAAMYRPITKKKKNGKYEIEKYDSETLEERAELFRQLDIKYFISGQFFFINFIRRYKGRIQVSMMLKGLPMKKKLRMIMKILKLVARLRKGGDTSILLTSLQKEILQNTIE